MFCNDFEMYCYDNNDDLIHMWTYIKNNGIPDKPIISREYFDELKVCKDLSFDRSFALFFCTFSAIYNTGYIENGTITDKRPYHDERYRGIKKVENIFNKINFELSSYKDIDVGTGNLIYCDPPYKNTIQPYKTNKFDSTEFWKIGRASCRERV